MIRTIDPVIVIGHGTLDCIALKSLLCQTQRVFPHLILLLILIILVVPSCTATQVRDWGGVTVTGKMVDISGNPVPDAHLYAYDEGKTNTLGPADAMSEPSLEDGSYILVVPEGTYTLVARKRLSGSISGPMKNGDLSGQLTEPFRATGNYRSGIDITMRVFRQGAEGDPQRILTTNTRITGTVVDGEGQALSGINVFAYRGSFRQDPPDYMAPATDSKGRFEISLPGGGEYTIGARTGFGGRPGPDDSMGFWGSSDQQHEIKAGTVVEGVRIVVRPYGEKP